MTTTFDKCLTHTLKWEGGYSNDPDDPGGATNHGISLRFLVNIGALDQYDFDNDGDLTPLDVRALTKEQAAILYKEYFWNDRYYDLPEDLAIKLFDLGVNMGPKQAVLLLQQEIGCRPYDGIYGNKTDHAVHRSRQDVLAMLIARAARFYYTLAAKRPASRKYLYGWLRRCYDV